MITSTWTSEIPTVPGYYSCIGWRSLEEKKYWEKTDMNTPRLMFVTVKRGANSLIFVADGNFMYLSEFKDAENLWKKIEIEFPEGVSIRNKI